MQQVDKNKMAARLLLLLISAVCFSTSSAGCPARCRSCQNNATDCSKSGLVNPPKDFDPETRSVNIDGNALRVLGKNSFGKLPRVEVLRASGNRIRVVKKDSFASLPQLMTVDLSNNKIARLYSKTFVGVKNMKTLTMSNNNIATVTGILDVLPSLYQLNLGRNKIRVIHAKTFYKNTRLHYLDIRHNNLIRIHPDAFKHQKYLRYLFLQYNPLVSLPALNIGSPVLQLVDLSHCKLKKVPQGLPASVRDLRLGFNQIEEIRKKDFIKITNLRLLALNNNKIKRVAFLAFTKLENLEEIWLRDNLMNYIPRGLPDNLKKLYMDQNDVVNIEKVLFSNSSKLEYLTLENNRVMDIEPGSLSRLHFLKYLNLQGNKLSTLSKGVFADVRNMSTLTLSNNPIVKIEQGAFRDLRNLTFLYMMYIPPSKDFQLQENFLLAMPNLKKLSLMGSQSLTSQLLDVIDNTPVMKSLTEVDLTFNDILTLPSSLRRILPNVQALSIDGNSLYCDDRMLWLAQWMKSSDVKFFLYEEPTCEYPYHHQGKLLTAVPESEYVMVKRELRPLPPLPEQPPEPESEEKQSFGLQVKIVDPEAKEAEVKPPVQASPSRVIKGRGPPSRRIAAAKSSQDGKDRRGRKRRRNKRQRDKNDKKRRRKRRHRKTDGERRKRKGRGKGKGRKGKGRKRNRKQEPVEQTTPAA